MLLFDSRLRLFPGKLKSKWNGLFVISQVFPHGAVELKDEQIRNHFKVNGQRLKAYFGEDQPPAVRQGKNIYLD